MSDKHVDMVIRQALGQGNAGSGHSCPDHNLLAAYLENRLRGAEKDAFEIHTAECPSCRRLLAMAMTIGEEPEAVVELQYPKPKKLLFRFSIPVSSFVMILVAVTAGFLFWRSSKQPGGAPPLTQTAELRAPAPKPLSEPATIPQEISSAAPAQDRELLAEKKGIGSKAAMVERKTAPAAKMPATPSTPIGERAAVGEIDELRTKPEAQPQAAAGVGYAPVRSEGISADRAVRAKDASGAVVGGVVGGVNGDLDRAAQTGALQKTMAFKLAATMPAPHEAILEAGRQRGEADLSRWKKVGDREFRNVSGYWIDEQCSRSPDRTIVDTSEGGPDLEEIMKLYPELRSMRPVIILWKDRILVLR